MGCHNHSLSIVPLVQPDVPGVWFSSSTRVKSASTISPLAGRSGWPFLKTWMFGLPFILAAPAAMMALRIGGISNAKPTASVKNPGVNRTTPAINIKAPCAIWSIGFWPDPTEFCRFESAAIPCERKRVVPMKAVRTTINKVGQRPIRPPT